MFIFQSLKNNNEINGFPNCRFYFFPQIIFLAFIPLQPTCNRDSFNMQRLLRESMKYFFLLIAKLKDSS